jgi:hypothetical protein
MVTIELCYQESLLVTPIDMLFLVSLRFSPLTDRPLICAAYLVFHGQT